MALLQVPAGRGGLTPDPRLSYNSRRVDGILTWIQTDWLGLGWTLDSMAIVRKITPDYTPSGGRPALLRSRAPRPRQLA